MAKVTRADIASAKVEVRRWEELCSAFNFRVEVPSEARDMLIKMFAHLSAVKITNSLARRVQCMEMASQVVDVWLLWCKQNRCTPDLHQSADEMLRGVFVDPVTRAGAATGRMPHFKGMVKGKLLRYGFSSPPVESNN